MKEDMDLEHRRRVAAEAILGKVQLSGGAHVRRLIHGHPKYIEWQSIIKEAGE
jgi:hypothetical protein